MPVGSAGSGWQTPPDGPPEIVGRYSLYGRIASGGMATVHLGRLLGPVGFSRTVAIKKLHINLSQDPDFVLGFIDEARLAARIQHPNVVPTLDVVSEKGQLLLVMEYVMGESLARLVRAVVARGELVPPKIAASILSSALHGLHAAHEATNDFGKPLEIVHRDVSPHNILVGSDGVTRVLDFGVAKAMGRLQSTGEGTLKGKVAYMAPEQIRAAGVDRRTDIYAAGVVLWETLTGRRMFQADTQVEVFARVLAGCQEPPSTHVPNLPESFDRVTMRALSSDPNGRFATAREMAMALEGCAGIATPSEVGPWVVSLASDDLAERARAVADVESSSGIVVLPSDIPLRSRDDELTRTGPNIALLGAAATAKADTDALIEARVDAPPSAGNVRQRARLAIVCGGVVALVLATWLVASRSTGKEVLVVTAPAASLSTAAPPAAASAPPPIQSAAVPVDPAMSGAPPAEGAPAANTANASKAPRATPHTSVRAPGRPNGCVPPYTVDSSGFRVPKPECL